MPESLRVAYARGVTPGKWARGWGERFPRVPLELAMLDAVTDACAELAVLRDGSAELALIRLPAGADGEPEWPGGSRPDDIHFIPLYEERPFAVAAKGNAIEAADEVTTADVADEVRHPFDDDVATAVEVVAANVGVVVVPQSIARLYARKDVVARPIVDEPGWRIGLAWLRASDDPRIDDFIGVVRGRTANSSRGAGASASTAAGADAAATPAPRNGDGGSRPKRPAPARPSRGGRPRRRPTR